MTKHQRRRLIQGLAASYPAIWTAPVVTSVVLPAHAQTSPTESDSPRPLSSCGPVTASDEEIDGVDLDRVLLFFDGDDCRLEIRDSLEGVDTDALPNFVIAVDVDGNGTNYEIERAGSDDWSINVSPAMGLTDPDLNFVATRQTSPGMGNEFDVRMRVRLDAPEMRVSVRVFEA